MNERVFHVEIVILTTYISVSGLLWKSNWRNYRGGHLSEGQGLSQKNRKTFLSLKAPPECTSMETLRDTDSTRLHQLSVNCRKQRGRTIVYTPYIRHMDTCANGMWMTGAKWTGSHGGCADEKAFSLHLYTGPKSRIGGVFAELLATFTRGHYLTGMYLFESAEL